MVKKLALLFSFLTLATACRTTPHAKPLANLTAAMPPDDARQRARTIKDPGLAAVVAWLEGNDRAYARERLDAGIEGSENKLRLRIARAALSINELDDVAARDDLVHVLASAWDAPEAELAMVLLFDRLTPARDAASLSPVLELVVEKGRAERVMLATMLQARIAKAMNKDDDARAAIARGGYLTAWRGIGPIAPLDTRALDEQTRYETSGDWSAPDPFRGAQPPVRDYGDDKRGHLRVAEGAGLYVFETYVELKEEANGKPLTLEVHLSSSSRIRIDDQQALRVDVARRARPELVRVPVRANAGWHRITLTTLAGRSTRPSIALLGADGKTVVARQAKSLPSGAKLVVYPPSIGAPSTSASDPDRAPALVDRWIAEEPWRWFGRTMASFVYLSGWYEDVEGAKERLIGVSEAAPGSAAMHLTSARLMRWARRPSGMVQAAVAEALEHDPEHPAALVSLAAAIRSDDPDRALELTERAAKAAPRSVRPDALRLQIYRQRGWNAEAVALLEALVERDPPASVLRDGAQLLRSLDRVEDANRLLDRADAMTGDAESVDVALTRGDVDAAIARLKERGGPNNFTRAARLHFVRNEIAEAKKALEDALARDPDDAGALEVALRIAVMERDTAEVRRVLGTLRTRGAATMQHEVLASLALDEPLVDRDGGWLDAHLDADLWADIRYLPGTTIPKGLDPADPRTRYQSVRLLDRVVDYVRPNGQALSWRHEVRRLQTKEATDKAGEFQIPADALPLQLRTLKPDGRVLDVDRHSGKDDLSFSALAPGDAVEMEWIDLAGSATPWGGYMRRFYFSGTTPIARADYIVVVPKGTKVWTHSYHGAPEPTIHEEDGRTIYAFSAENIEAFEPEPHSAPFEEFLPFVAVAIGIDHDRALETNTLGVDALSRTSWDVEVAARRIVEGVSAEDEKIRALFDWVTKEIGDGQAREPSVTLATRRGDRAGVLAAMLRAVDVPATIVMAASGVEAQVSPRYPDTSRFDIRLVRITRTDQPASWAFLQGSRPWLGRLPPAMRGGAYVEWAKPTAVHPIRSREVDTWALSSHVDLEVDASGNAAGHVEITLPGTYGAQLREFLLGARREAADRQLQGWIAGFLPGARLVDFSTVNAESPLEPFGLKARVAVDHFMTREGGHLVNEQFFVEPLASQSIGVPSLASYLRSPLRESPLLLQESQEQMTVVVRFPTGSAPPVQAPQSVTRVLEFGQFSQAFEWDAKKHEARLVRVQQMPLLRLSPAAFPAFRESAQEILQAFRNRLVVPIPSLKTAMRSAH